MHPVVCLITGGARLGAAGAQATAPRVAAAARAGVHLVIVRERDLEGRALTALVRSCVEAVRGTRTRVLVNDRLDVAVAAGAHGVHLRGDSMLAVRARALAPPAFLIGRSVHSRTEAERVVDEGALDYLLFGAVFDTQSKPGITPAGVTKLAAVAAATRLPVLAVGGMTLQTLPGLSRTGAAGFAAIGLFADPSAASFAGLVAEASRAFDAAAMAQP